MRVSSLVASAWLGGLAAFMAPNAAIAESSGRLVRFVGADRVPNGLGVNIHENSWDLGSLHAIRAVGFRLIRTDLLWATVEREAGRYDWGAADALIAAARSAGLTPLLILAYSNPLYARATVGQEGVPSRAYAPPVEGDARAAFMRFVTAAASRYGKDAILEVWNEPDLNFGEPVNLQGFAGFAAEACRRAREGAPESAIIGPAASGFAWRLMSLVQAADAEHCFDAISVHPYRDRAPDDVVADWAELAAKVCPGEIDCKRLVSSEWGYSAWGGIWTRERQADFVLRSYLLNVLAGVPVSIIYDWRDDGPSPDDKEANFGLLDHAGRPKPVFTALSALLAELKGLRFLGQIPAHGRGTIVLAFGGETRPTKLVGWSSRRDQEVTVPADACVLGRSEGFCPAEPVRLGVEMKLHLNSRPAVTRVPGPVFSAGP